MQRRLFLAAAAVTTVLATSTHGLAADAKPVELFGTPLKGASRDQLGLCLPFRLSYPLKIRSFSENPLNLVEDFTLLQMQKVALRAPRPKLKPT